MDPRSVTSTAFKRVLSENDQASFAATEQQNLEGKKFWFNLSNIQVWGVKMVAGANGDIHYTLRTRQCRKSIIRPPARVPYEGQLWLDGSVSQC